MLKTVAIIGGSGALGTAFTQLLSSRYPNAHLHVLSRHLIENPLPTIRQHLIHYEHEDTLAQAASLISNDAPLDYVIVATGLLHDDGLMPEKALKDCSSEKFQRLFAANTIFPALVAKHFLPLLNNTTRSVFAALSARVGSISDNHLGGWYGYRASKAALNMIIKTAAIEVGRRNQQAVIVGVHPGTVASNLSKPFQANVPVNKLFTPAFSVEKLWQVLETIKPEHSGRCFAWDGQEIKP